MAEKQSLLKKIFRIGIDNSKNRGKLYPTTIKRDIEGNYTNEKELFPPKVQELYDHWQTNCHDNSSSFEDRTAMFQDMEMLYYNSPWLWRAMNMMADETIQADSNMSPIGVEAEPKQRDIILKFLKDVNIDAYLRDAALGVIQFGNHGWILSLDDTGVKEIIPIDVKELLERLEFTPYKVRQEMQDSMSVIRQMHDKFDRIKVLVDSITKDEEYASYYKSYLFGFQVGEMMLPPWRFVHFRNYTSRSPFYPFGMPYFIHSVAPYRQFDAALSLRIAARGASFPIDNFAINLPNIIDPTEKMDKALEMMRELDNIGVKKTNKEGVGIGERIVTIRDLFDYDQITPQIELGQLGELDVLENMIIVSTGLPRNFLDPNDGSFGNSGIALMQQFKPFARAVFHIQSVLLKNITQVIKIHLIQSGAVAVNEINFRLTMPYPESQVNGELITNQKDLLDLAGSILDTLRDRILGEDGGSLPPEMVQQVMTQILPYDADRIDSWVKTILKHKEDSAANAPDGEAGGEADVFGESRKVLKEVSPSVLREMISKTVSEKKGEVLREGVMFNRHFYSSHLKDMDFDVRILEEAQKKQVQKLQEEYKLEEKKKKAETLDEVVEGMSLAEDEMVFIKFDEDEK